MSPAMPVALMYRSVTPYQDDPYLVTASPQRFETADAVAGPAWVEGNICQVVARRTLPCCSAPIGWFEVRRRLCGLDNSRSKLFFPAGIFNFESSCGVCDG